MKHLYTSRDLVLLSHYTAGIVCMSVCVGSVILRFGWIKLQYYLDEKARFRLNKT